MEEISPDALTGSALAAKYDAPTLLVDKETVPTFTKNAYSPNQTYSMLFLGGEAVISNQVMNELTNTIK
ncbi:cell wall-binding repeat-containing protein [Bacillus carboniphilus]|uniref:Cell wall-binding repeat-containing protein n=1 Tax=Bacillus carboniphilus TaxID=86663 RepID=A0ABY9JTH9_9BACI|nr:cell wall-binding repeat-containing protein [Bacillus carboniphilus]WLR41598.1 cell wall-binding repeat-containing protein [Bacillus carboniphilus]